ncbi:MAG: hypothetical protein E6Y82_05830 [Clostridium perfringens]|nr:hypothetical protein [Clostridium perfringens]
MRYLTLDLDEDERELIQENKIEQKKTINRELARARKESKQEKCKYCGKETTSFCNSHTLPAFCLRNIANEGKVLITNALVGFPLIDEEKGVNNAGTFQLICRDCDSKIFQEYEDPENYKEKPTNEMLAQIAMKNSLRYIGKRQYEYAIFDLPIFGNGATNIFGVNLDDVLDEIEAKSFNKYNKELDEMSDFLDFLKELQGVQKGLDIKENMHISQELDLKELEDSYQLAKNRALGIDKSQYELVFYEKLNYVTPIAFQGQIALIQDFNNEIINDKFCLDPEYKIMDLNICIFPLKNETVVMIFMDSEYKERYKNFCIQFDKLCLEEKLSVINYMIFLYSEDIFLSKKLGEEVLKNENLIEVAQTTEFAINDLLFDSGEETEKETYNLNKHTNIPNLLSEEYKLR